MNPYAPRQPKPTDPAIAEHIESLFRAHPPAQYELEDRERVGWFYASRKREGVR